MDILGRGLLLARTVRHLRPRQVAWRLLRGLRRTPPAAAGPEEFPAPAPAHVDALAAAAAHLHDGWRENAGRASLVRRPTLFPALAAIQNAEPSR